MKFCGCKSETIWCIGLKFSMGHEHYRYYEHTKFCQNLSGESMLISHGMTHIVMQS